MKSLACIFGRHRWTTHAEHGEEYKVCSRCGKMPKDLTSESYAAAQRAAEQRIDKTAGDGSPDVF